MEALGLRRPIRNGVCVARLCETQWRKRKLLALPFRYTRKKYVLVSKAKRNRRLGSSRDFPLMINSGRIGLPGSANDNCGSRKRVASAETNCGGILVERFMIRTGGLRNSSVKPCGGAALLIATAAKLQMIAMIDFIS